MTKITITIDYSLQELAAKYREHMGMDKKTTVTKSEIATWLAGLVEADIQ